MGSKGAEPNKAKEKYNHTNQNEEGDISDVSNRLDRPLQGYLSGIFFTLYWFRFYEFER